MFSTGISLACQNAALCGNGLNMVCQFVRHSGIKLFNFIIISVVSLPGVPVHLFRNFFHVYFI